MFKGDKIIVSRDKNIDVHIKKEKRTEKVRRKQAED